MEPSEDSRPSKRMKQKHTPAHEGKRQRQTGKWKAHKTNSSSNVSISASGIHSDDAGIFVSCDKGHENKCIRELNDLLPQYFDPKAGDSADGNADNATNASDNDDVEKSIAKELEAMKPSDSAKALTFVKLDIPCVTFVKTGNWLDPVSLVHSICKDALAKPDQQRSRFIKRMTPMTLMRKTLGNGLEQVCQSVLPPHFHFEAPSKKYAIRPTIRNNNILKRDDVIKTVASAVGDQHTVDLTNYDLLILVDVYRNVCGMSVVGNDYESLKKFNLAEIYQPTPRPQAKPVAVPTSSKSSTPPS